MRTTTVMTRDLNHDQSAQRARSAARVLRQECVPLLDVWSSRVRGDGAIPNTPSEGEHAQRHRFPSLIEDLAQTLELVAREGDPEGTPAHDVAGRSVHAYALARIEAGSPIGATLREIAHLRAAIDERLEAKGASDSRVARSISAWVEDAMRVAAEETAGAALSASETTYRTLIEGIPDQASFRLDAEGSVLSWSRAAERVQGFAAENAVGARHAIFFTTEDRGAGLPERLLREAEATGIASHQGRRVRHDGSVFFAEVALTSRREPDGRLSGYAVIVRDLTGSTEAERTRRTRDALLQAVIDRAPSIIFVKDLEGRNLFANRLFETTLGVARDDIAGKHDDEIFAADEVRAFRANDERVIARNAVIEVEEQIHHADGVHTYLSTKFPICDGDGAVWAIGGISTDITERQRAEQALRDSEWSFRTMFDLAPIGIVDVDVATARVTRANAEASRMVGHASGGLDGADVLELTHEDDRALAEAALAPVLAGLEPVYDHEKRFRRKGGGWLRARVRAIFVRDDEGRPVRALALLEDVGARRELELLRERLIGIVAHDLRGPLSTLRMALQLLRARDPSAPCDAYLIGRIDKASYGMEEMISTLLDFARAQGDAAFPIDRQDADLAELARGVVEDHAMASPERRIELEIEGETRGRWDTSRLAQVIGNLLSNALRHGDPKVAVRVIVRARADGDVELEVWNHGPPIPRDLRSTIFEPYRRGHTAHPSAKGGVGLGLYITCAIVRAHGGTLRITRSDAEHGTTFAVQLPRAR